MAELDSKQIAQNMMVAHGLLAQAVVKERIEESRLQGDASGLARWQNVEAAINELRRTAPRSASAPDARRGRS
jgi:hypothetical protein